MPRRAHNPATGDPLPADVPAKFGHLLHDPNVARWHRNLAQGSLKTARDYLRTLGLFLEGRDESPAQYLALGQRACEDVLHDFVSARLAKGRAGSSTAYFTAVVQSWMKWNDMPLRRPVKVPRKNYSPRVRQYHIPSVEELRRVLGVCSARQRMTLGCIAFAGLRPGALGNMTGTDGIRFSDLPDTHFEANRLVFDKVPTRIVVREELSKAKHQYFTMLGQEGCDYIAAYVDQRTHAGEAMGPDSPLLPPSRGENGFLLAESVGDLLRRPMREVAINLPPYIWRSYFNNRALFAESNGFVRDYRVFFMGHRGDMEHTYALRKRIGEDMLEQMRESYLKAAPALESRTGAPAQGDPIQKIAEAALKGCGMDSAAISALDLPAMDEDGLVKILMDALANRVEAPAQPVGQDAQASQQLVTLEQMRGLLAKGWRYASKLDDNTYLVEAPT
ncbi:MAG: hypothetical protein ACYDBQ_01305 [Thermoplasmatota archaeon]